MNVARVADRGRALALELGMPEGAQIRIDENGLSRCIRGKLVHEPDIAGVEFPFAQRLARGELRSLVIAPLLAESRVFGVLVAARRTPHSFTSGECEFLRQLSEHVALAASQARTYTALQQAYDELRQTTRAVLQQERLRALGQMASGIAHDINNALSPVGLYTESLLEREPGLSKRAREYLETIQRAIDDVGRTVARMREFYRPREAQLVLARVELNELIKQVIDMTRARWSDLPQQRGVVIDVKTELCPDLPAIQGAESEIRDALTNLVFNAVDAMPEGGTLTCRTTTVCRAPGDEGTAPTDTCIEVQDTGVGMDEETRRRCVEPFFTTKGERGTGLGLASVYGMVERHSGTFEVRSEPARGTTIRLVFPASAQQSMSIVERHSPGAPVRNLRILIVDDDPVIIESLRNILQSDGHRVTAAEGGQAGIDAFGAALELDEPFDAVITDLGMPHVDGRKVAASIGKASPGTPIILLTGWGQRLLDENDLPAAVHRVLAKPPRLSELRSALSGLTQQVAAAPT
jgi:signal transduction histidine kinase/ActR/RegA family two-component response regulator